MFALIKAFETEPRNAENKKKNSSKMKSIDRRCYK